MGHDGFLDFKYQ